MSNMSDNIPVVFVNGPLDGVKGYWQWDLDEEYGRLCFKNGIIGLQERDLDEEGVPIEDSMKRVIYRVCDTNPRMVQKAYYVTTTKEQWSPE